MPKKLSLERMLGQERHLLALAVCVWEHELVDDVLGREGAVRHGELVAGGHWRRVETRGGGHNGDKEEENSSKRKGDISDYRSTMQGLSEKGWRCRLSHNADLLGMG